MNMKFSTLLLASALFTTMPSYVRANFASDPTRKDTPSFTRFFLKRFDKWFVANVGDPRKGLDKKEIEFVEEYLRTLDTFGAKKGESFSRNLSYGIVVDGDMVTPGPFRFVLSETQSSLKSKLTRIALAKGLSPDNLTDADFVGIGFTGKKDEIEIIFKDETGALVPETMKKSLTTRPLRVIRLFRGGKLASTEVLGMNVSSDGPCVGSRAFSQVDRVVYEGGETVVSCHVTLLEDRALLPAARSIAVKIRRGVNLFPGVLEVSGKRVRLFYP